MSESIKIPKMHGETTIVLKNVKTGLVERYHDENVFQAFALQKFMRSFGLMHTTDWCGSLVGNYPSIVDVLCGGLMLFRDTIQEGTEFIPGGNQMVGNGAYLVANAEEPNELGSYNSVESSKTESSVTNIWDFTTNQANGQISCVSLVNRAVAMLGVGNYSGGLKDLISGSDVLNGGITRHYFETPKYENLPPNEGTPNKRGMFRQTHMIYNNYCYNVQYNYSDKSLKIYRWKLPYARMSVLDMMKTEEYDSFDMNNYTPLGCLSSNNDIPATSITSYYCQMLGSKIIIKGNRTDYEITDGSDNIYFEYDVSTKTLTKKSWTNSTGESLFGGGAVYYLDDAVIVSSWNNAKRFVIRLVDSVVISQKTVSTYRMNLAALAPINPSKTLIYSYGAIENYKNYVYDRVSDVFLPVNGGKDNYQQLSGGNTFDYNSELDLLAEISSYYYLGTPGFHTNPFYLATINNLQQAVTKTAAQTMKVTYTLTEVSQ